LPAKTIEGNYKLKFSIKRELFLKIKEKRREILLGKCWISREERDFSP